MVQAIIDIDKQANHVLNIVKAKFALRTKSEAIEKMAEEYAQNLLEETVRPEYIQKLERINKQKGIRFKSVADLEKHLHDSLLRDKTRAKKKAPAHSAKR